jgi:hypothetical protein
MKRRDSGRSGEQSGRIEVLGPNGRLLTRADLPPPGTRRWVIRRKAEVVAGVRGGLISLAEACRRYALSVEEFRSWERSLAEHGLAGLHATRGRKTTPAVPGAEAGSFASRQDLPTR